MGKVFGIIALILGIASIAIVWFLWLSYYLIALPIAAIVFGGIGIAKDDSKALGIVGLILGIISLVIWIMAPFILVGFFFWSLIP